MIAPNKTYQNELLFTDTLNETLTVCAYQETITGIHTFCKSVPIKFERKLEI